MNIAYIVDGSTELSPSNKKLKNVFTLSFKGYNDKGVLEDINDKMLLDVYQSLDTKQYIEPTPGRYRDLYQKLKQNGYDYIIVIPQLKRSSISYKNAEYASRLYDNVLVLDVSEYNLSINQIIKNLISDKEINQVSFSLGLDSLFDLIKNTLLQVNLAQ